MFAMCWLAQRTIKADLSKLVDMSNVKKITYSSENGNTVKVSKTGTIQAKKSGNATVKVKVTLKNGSTKTV